MNLPLRPYWQLLVNYLRPQSLQIALLALLIFTNIGLQLVNPQIIRYFLDTAQAGGAPVALWWAAGVFMGFALLQQALSVAATYVGESVSWAATNELRADLAFHCLKLDLSFHKARTPGELIERIDGDVTALASFFSQFVIQVMGNVVLLIGVLVLLWREDWRVGLGLTGFALIALFVLLWVRNVGVPYRKAIREMSAHFFGYLGEHLAGTEDTRSSGATAYVMNRFYALWRTWLPLRVKADLMMYSGWLATLTIFGLGTAVAFGLSAYLWEAGAITIGTVYLIFNYTELLRQPIEQIRTQLQELQQASAGIERVTELFQVASRIDDTGHQRVPEGALAVDFDQVMFGYDTDDTILHGLSFHLQPGRVLGLLGRTGSGKTTLARLLLRLYDTTTGEIRLSGLPLREAALEHLRQRVGLVTQDVQLFQATIRDNLTFFDRSISDHTIRLVLDDLGLGPWYRALPEGLDTPLDADGAGLSAGEAQLLAFARLFLRDPGLVILDEASSRLDPATEQLIERAISKLLKDRTAVIIAHRLGTVQRADDIMILDKGRIAEYGPREQLARDPRSRFAHLLQVGLEGVLA
jgi:ATP-binding cassette, subfamily B, bacterial